MVESVAKISRIFLLIFLIKFTEFNRIITHIFSQRISQIISITKVKADF